MIFSHIFNYTKNEKVIIYKNYILHYKINMDDDSHEKIIKELLENRGFLDVSILENHPELDDIDLTYFHIDGVAYNSSNFFVCVKGEEWCVEIYKINQVDLPLDSILPYYNYSVDFTNLKSGYCDSYEEESIDGVLERLYNMELSKRNPTIKKCKR